MPRRFGSLEQKATIPRTDHRWAGDEIDLDTQERIVRDPDAPLGGAIVAALVYGPVAWAVVIGVGLAAYAIFRAVT